MMRLRHAQSLKSNMARLLLRLLTSFHVHPKEVNMHAQVAPKLPLFDTLFFAQEANIAENPTARNRVSPSHAILRSNGENLLSLLRAYERLSLLAQMELPCTILIVSPPQHLRHTVIKTVNLESESLAILGNGFNLYLHGPNFHTIRLVNHSKIEDGIASLDIHQPQGMLYASIQPAVDGLGSAVWRDVMDNPSLSLA
jgi:hypothetical protein